MPSTNTSTPGFRASGARPIRRRRCTRRLRPAHPNACRTTSPTSTRRISTNRRSSRATRRPHLWLQRSTRQAIRILRLLAIRMQPTPRSWNQPKNRRTRARSKSARRARFTVRSSAHRCRGRMGRPRRPVPRQTSPSASPADVPTASVRAISAAASRSRARAIARTGTSAGRSAAVRLRTSCRRVAAVVRGLKAVSDPSNIPRWLICPVNTASS